MCSGPLHAIKRNAFSHEDVLHVTVWSEIALSMASQRRVASCLLLRHCYSSTNSPSNGLLQRLVLAVGYKQRCHSLLDSTYLFVNYYYCGLSTRSVSSLKPVLEKIRNGGRVQTALSFTIRFDLFVCKLLLLWFIYTFCFVA